ncbi:hypothetical protein CC78DRAFT_563843 [Lojkania enalia]|uniref:Borealin N-terminal domain-containing protein n=1 Tax=Lojkania enalia TaxID=147567 RepID=A0A9P4TRH9_9PLEO|nr:hypothetical protein CC78DRAFT_563843 [Didymosphaeria enalia]
MMTLTLSAEAKASMITNFKLELNARREKLASMYEAQAASLRSRLERRVNRIPSNKRNMKLIDFLDCSPPVPPAPVKKEIAPAVKRTRAAPARPVPPTRTVSKPAAKPARGTKRASDEISGENKENAAELAVPKKRTKAAATRTATAMSTSASTRTTRAASRKATVPEVLSPKSSNPIGTQRQTRTRRVR